MSDHKRNENYNEKDTQALLYELLQRLDQRDETRDAAYAVSEQLGLVSSERFDEEEDLRLDPVPFQPDLILIEDPDPVAPDADFSHSVMSEADLQDLLLLEDAEDPDAFAAPSSDEELPEPPAERRNPFVVLWSGFCSNLPRREDSTGTKVRKYGFLTSLLVMLVAIVYLVVDLLIIPAKNEQLKQELLSLYHPEKSTVIVTKEEAEKGNYPDRMLASFVDLYRRNNEVRGWISYHSSGNKDFLDIEYPIVHSGDNEKYLKKDFDGNKNRNGTLFFDQNNTLDSYKDTNRSLIVYGHNMASGQMFAGLNKLLGSVSNARASATLTMSTLFREDEYKVFAVILTDESDKKKGRYFNTRRTAFADGEDFLQYIEQMRERSLFDYPVDVQENDQILVLSTCTGKSSAHVKDGRVVVVARRVRDGEDPGVKTSAIAKNTDVIMPYYWYINQKKTPHAYYTQNGLQSDADLTTQTAGSNSTSTSTTIGSTVETTIGTGTDVTVSTDADSTTTTTVGNDTPSTAAPSHSTGATSASSTVGSDTTSTTGSATNGDATTSTSTQGETTTVTGESTTTGATEAPTTGTTEGTTTGATESTTEAPTTTTSTEAPTTTTTQTGE